MFYVILIVWKNEEISISLDYMKKLLSPAGVQLFIAEGWQSYGRI